MKDFWFWINAFKNNVNEILLQEGHQVNVKVVAELVQKYQTVFSNCEVKLDIHKLYLVLFDILLVSIKFIPVA